VAAAAARGEAVSAVTGEVGVKSSRSAWQLPTNCSARRGAAQGVGAALARAPLGTMPRRPSAAARTAPVPPYVGLVGQRDALDAGGCWLPGCRRGLRGGLIA
jgi:hypothetical protein